MRTVIAAALAVAVAAHVARADDPPPDAPLAPDAAPAPPADAPAPPPPDAAPTPQPAPSAPTPDELAARIDDLEEQQRKLRTELHQRADSVRDEVHSVQWLRRFITVFVDVGGFAVGGNGSGIRSDLDHIYFPQYANRLPGQWVFMGDPLATAINSLDEPADTSDSREVAVDTLKSKGHPSAILNALGLSIDKDVGHRIEVKALAELLPRPGDNIVDVELAYIDYQPVEDLDLHVQAGKIDSMLGVEYRSQDAPRRLGVTPSLICRYTCGRPIGVEARLVRGDLMASAAVTNGDTFDHRFEPETSIHANPLPTGSAHLQWQLPVGRGLVVGVSGALGPQTNQPDMDVAQWHVGFDARLRDLDRFDITAEYVQGLQQGKTITMTPCDAAPCLSYKGAYLLVDRRVAPWVTPYVRFDWRDAVHQNGVQFVYESHVARATLGAHFEMTSRIIAKIEYTFTRELDGIPQFPDDVLTSSIVVATD